MTSLTTELRHALRGLVEHRLHTGAVIATLALGIGASAAVFTLANWLLLRPLPHVRNPSQLVTVTFMTPGGAIFPFSGPMVEALEAGLPALEALAGFQACSLNVAPAGGGTPRRLDGEVVGPAYFRVLDGTIARGRGFTRTEGLDPGAPPAVVVSDRYWRTELGADPGALGRPVFVNGVSFTVIGITGRGFHGTARTGRVDLWVPIGQHATALPMFPSNLLTSPRASVFFALVGRLATDARAATAAEQADVVRGRLAEMWPKDRRFATSRFVVGTDPDPRPWVRERLTRSMTLLLGIVGLLLVLACANVTNLVLARTAARREELATRLALGASRWRVARLLLVESLMLAVGAGAAGLGVAWTVGRLLAGTVMLPGLPPLDRPGVDATVLAFVFGLTVITAAGTGIVPALAAGRLDVATAVRVGGWTGARPRRRTRRVLTVAQVAVSLTLLAGALLLASSMAARHAIDPGFDPEKVLAFSVEPGLQPAYRGPAQDRFYRNLLARVREVPGVGAAGLAWLRPYSQGAADTAFRADRGLSEAEHSAEINAVSPGFFAALGVPLVDGRDFTEAEFLRPFGPDDGAVIVTASVATKLFGTPHAAGRRIIMSHPEGQARTIVGVVGNLRQRRVTDPPADALFEPFGGVFPIGWATVLVGPSAPVERVLPLVRDAAARADATLPIYDVMTLGEAIDLQLADDILVTRLAAAFALIATLLAAVGLFGVLARGVAERRRELAVRTALGAAPASIVGLVAGEALRLTLAGIAAGLAGAGWLSRLLEHRLYGVSRLDPAALAGAVLVMVFVAVAAAAAPARRATRIDAAEALKS